MPFQDNYTLMIPTWSPSDLMGSRAFHELPKLSGRACELIIRSRFHSERRAFGFILSFPESLSTKQTSASIDAVTKLPINDKIVVLAYPTDLSGKFGTLLLVSFTNADFKISIVHLVCEFRLTFLSKSTLFHLHHSHDLL